MQVPVQVCRMVTEQQVRQVPVQVCRMVQEEHVRKVPYTTCRQVVERVPRQVEVKVCRMVTEQHVRQVPVTTCRMVEEKHVEPFEVRVCKWVCEKQTVQVPRVVTKQVPVTYTVPRSANRRGMRRAQRLRVRGLAEWGKSCSWFTGHEVTSPRNGTSLARTSLYRATFDTRRPASETNCFRGLLFLSRSQGG